MEPAWTEVHLYDILPMAAELMYGSVVWRTQATPKNDQPDCRSGLKHNAGGYLFFKDKYIVFCLLTHAGTV